MKKLFLGTICAIALMFVSCKPSVDSLIDDLETALQDKDYKEIKEIAQKMDELKIEGELTKEQEKRIIEISENYEETFKDFMEEYINK